MGDAPRTLAHAPQMLETACGMVTMIIPHSSPNKPPDHCVRARNINYMLYCDMCDTIGAHHKPHTLTHDNNSAPKRSHGIEPAHLFNVLVGECADGLTVERKIPLGIPFLWHKTL